MNSVPPLGLGHVISPSLLPLAHEAPAREEPPSPRPKLTPAQAFQKFLPLALALAPEQVKDFKGVDLAVVHPNVRRGVRAITPHLGHIRATLPGIPLDAVLALPSLSFALLHAHAIITRPTGVTRDALDARYAKLQELRVPMLHQAQVFKHLGPFPAKRVEAVAAGGGMFAHAMSAIGLHALFTEFRAEVAQRHPFTDAQVAQVAEHGMWLLDNITPAGARPDAPETNESRDVRNRFWTLIVERHALLRRIGYNLFPEDAIDAHVPALQARAVTSGRAGEDVDEDVDEGEAAQPEGAKPS